MYIPGIIKGKHIELAHQTGIADGMSIIVNIQPLMPTYQEQQKLVDHLCGVFKNDPNLSKIFAEIDEQRHRSLPREISFDLSS